ncbi:hypothetical protein ACHAXS_011558 [Conticribra weissflogii]
MDGTGGGWFASPGARLKVNRSGCEHRGSEKSFDFPDGFLRLRPSTADILIDVASPSPHSVILDPCAGIGTIPLRSSIRSHYSIGGELSEALFSHFVPQFIECHKKSNKSSQVADLAGWDATLLPLRDSFVDVIISDIPFGQKCLSTNLLSVFLPSLLYQCARVLVHNGKMVLLCGNFETILNSLNNLNGRSRYMSEKQLDSEEDGGHGRGYSEGKDSVFELPCDSVFPVNIGGLIAWIIVVRRGKMKPLPPTNYRQSAKRAMVNRINGEKSKEINKQKNSH